MGNLESKVLENTEVDSEGLVQTIPEHGTLSLTNEDTAGVKWFTTLAEMEDGELVVQSFSKERILDTDFGDDDTFEQLTNGTVTDLNGNSVQTKVLTKRLGIFA